METLFFAQNKKPLIPCAIATTVDPKWAENANYYGVDLFRLEMHPTGKVSDLWVRSGKTETVNIWTNELYVFTMHYDSDYTHFNLTATEKYGHPIKAVRDASSVELQYHNGELIENVYQDGSGNWYNGVKVGTLIWIIGYLGSANYQNGNPIPYINDSTTWAALTTPAYTFIGISDYARFYNGYAVLTGNLVSGNGWRVATLNDFNDLHHNASGIYGFEFTPAKALKSCRQINHPLG